MVNGVGFVFDFWVNVEVVRVLIFRIYERRFGSMVVGSRVWCLVDFEFLLCRWCWCLFVYVCF